MKVDLFDFELPEERIALHPAVPRDSARMLVVAPGEPPQDRHVTDLTDILQPATCWWSTTRGAARRAQGTRIRGEAGRACRSTCTSGSTPKPGGPSRGRPSGCICSTGWSSATTARCRRTVAGKGDTGEVTLEFELGGAVLDEAIKAHGAMPLPPYIEAKRADRGARPRRLPDGLCGGRRRRCGADRGPPFHRDAAAGAARSAASASSA